MSGEFKPFGVDAKVLEQARAVASDVVEVYGNDGPDSLADIARGEIWNDHVAVQAAMMALDPAYRDEIKRLADENRKRCGRGQ